ncbi:hypothetical protein [Flavobacterium granuli]|uniref:Ig-like domain (Group 2) n=1 Tax=Flavobacterium granuli TaxID=280093 RepID=A0ABU1S396_9FLAO|nr:hypothetical protein [Flavobacterium granuli]MDR6845412.1 hypothetical protein [Flavobacterium granuli]
MKTKFFALAMSLGLLISSCSSNDDDTVPFTVAPLTGTESIIVGGTTIFTSTTTGGTFTSSTPAVATVNATSGEIVGVSVGTSTITYTAQTISVTKTVTVSAIPAATGEITGPITANKTYAYGNYTMKGVVKINDGVTLTFEAGSTITVDKTTGDNALVVLKGGKLIANGTADKPVVFTEKSGIAGSWGGIIMYGDAPINAINGVKTSTSEDGNALPYGGTNDAHNGGSLKYVRVEYAGSKLADGTKELNGFSFYSVGSGTTLDHLVSYKGADDGFEFYGGTVSLTNAISYGNTDDSFDWQDGWNGQASTNWYAYQAGKGNFGMEIECVKNNNAYFPKVTNITLRRAAGTTPEAVGDVQVDAIQFKNEGNGDFSNIIIEGYGDYTEAGTLYTGAAIKIQDAGTNTNQVNGSKIKITNVKISGTSKNVLGVVKSPWDGVVTFPAANFVISTTATGASLTAGAWATVNGVDLTK